MKGILLAGGTGSRLYPSTIATSKQLLPIYDKPMVYYPLSTLMLAGIREILLISTPFDIPRFKQLLGNGNQWGVSIDYEIQKEPNGIPQAFTLGEKFINNNHVALILGDNIFYGNELSSDLERAKNFSGATIFASPVSDPGRYGIVEFDKKGKPLKLIEKPSSPKSKFAITGLYFYDNKVIKYSKSLRPSKRNELEIVDLLNKYKKVNKLKAEYLGRGGAWLDTGSIDDFYKTSAFVSALENRQGLKIACLEEIALNYKWVSKKNIKESISFYGNCLYANYLKKLI